MTNALQITVFIASLLLAITAPILAISYLRPILLRVLRGLCDGDGTAEFWIRCAYLMAVSGSLILTLCVGDFSADASPVESLRRTLALTLTGVFAAVAIISRNVWTQARPQFAPAVAASRARAAAGASAAAAARAAVRAGDPS